MLLLITIMMVPNMGCEEEALHSYLNWALEGTWNDSAAKRDLENELESAICAILEKEYASSEYSSYVDEITVSVDLGDYPPVIDITEFHETVGCGDSEYTNFSWKINWGSGDVRSNAQIDVKVKLTFGKRESSWVDIEFTSAGTGQVIQNAEDQFEGSTYEVEFTKVIYTTTGDGTTTTETNEDGGFGEVFMEVMIVPILRETYGF
ncbi:MAG: hypothetical protein QF645_03435 [Planctomycetota bacterium]|nr:hypothetical protein [Planctomycetota bacterium]